MPSFNVQVKPITRNNIQKPFNLSVSGTAITTQAEAEDHVRENCSRVEVIPATAPVPAAPPPTESAKAETSPQANDQPTQGTQPVAESPAQTTIEPASEDAK
jgi:hypothetical protein